MRRALAAVCFWIGMPCAAIAGLMLCLEALEGAIGESPQSERADRATASARLLRLAGSLGVTGLAGWALLRERGVSPPSPSGTSSR